MTISAGERSWDYSPTAFAILRDVVALSLGYEDRKEAYAGRHTDLTLMGFWIDPDDRFATQPVEAPADDIDYLMLHQDVEGILMPWCAGRVADRLRDILAHMEDDRFFHIWPKFSTKRHMIELMDLLDYAREESEVVVFSG